MSRSRPPTPRSCATVSPTSPGKIRLARATMANIRQNVATALGLKAVFLVTTMLGITGPSIPVLADTGATVLGTLNALRLLVSTAA